MPRSAATIVIDVGVRQRVDFYAADGHTRLSVPPAFVAGAGTTSHRVSPIDAAQAVMTIHFRPAGALPFLGTALGDLENSCVGLSEIWGHDGTILHERLIGAPTAAVRVALLEDFLLTRARSAAPRHPALTPVLNAVERQPSIRISDACELTGLSPKRLIALFRAEVGISPKAYVRVRRFQAALRQLDAGAVRGAGIAADLGYFDQAHFVREFRTFTATTPTQYAQRRISLPSHVGLERQ